MKPYLLIPGVPAAGHLTGGGWWHPGRVEGCPKCPKPQQRRGPDHTLLARDEAVDE